MKSALVVTGTRPEIIKMSPVLIELKKRRIPTLFVHCGQHYDYDMAQQFIEELELQPPDYAFKLRGASPNVQMARTIANINRVLEDTEPSVVLVEGDTTTVLAASLAANKRNIAVGHVEAGLRSFDLRMPEEHNRRLTDNLSTYLFAPTERARANLENEKVWGKIFVTGNTVVDAVNQHLPLAEKNSTILYKLRFNKFGLATAHKAENVDDLTVLRNFVSAFAESPLPIVYPMHPRTEKRLRQNRLLGKTKRIKNLEVLPPVGYLDFLMLMKNCEFVVTDSGGIQEEATAPAMRKPVLVIRVSTERQEAVEAGFAQVVGTEKETIIAAMMNTLEFKKQLPEKSPFGQGDAAEKIVDTIEEELAA